MWYNIVKHKFCSDLCKWFCFHYSSLFLAVKLTMKKENWINKRKIKHFYFMSSTYDVNYPKLLAISTKQLSWGLSMNVLLKINLAQLAGTVEYTDCIFAEW